MRGYIPPQTPEETLFCKKAEELCQRSRKTGVKMFSAFLDLRGQELFKAQLNKFKDLKADFYGGFSGDSERCIACVSDSLDTAEEWEYPITILYSKLSGEEVLSHRDFLGAIMSLKISREYVGDIIVSDKDCYIICHNNMAQILIDELVSVRHTSVSFSRYDGQFSYTRVPSVTKSTTVASLRLDAVVGAVLNISRSDATSLVKSGGVSANHLVVKKGDFEIMDGDVLSIKGHGKFKLIIDGGKSRKDRFFITYMKY